MCRSFFIDGAGIVDDGADGDLDMFDSGVVQGRFDRSVMGILEFGALVDCCGFVGGDLELLRQWVVLIGKHGGNVFIHGEVASAFF